MSSSSDSGPGTLRQAILDANANPGADAIVFAVSSVVPVTSMPQITDLVTIDGSTSYLDVEVRRFQAYDDGAVAFWFGAGSSGSSLQRVRVGNTIPTAVRIDPGVTGVSVTRVQAPEVAIQIGGSNNVIGATTDGSQNRFGTIQVTGTANAVYRSSIANVLVLFGSNNRLGDAANGNQLGYVSIQSSPGTVVEGNRITAGIVMYATYGSSLVGGLISGNTLTRTGIRLTSATGIRITGNSINDVDLPIDLGSDGVTPNDVAPDSDTGPNNLQNFPVLTAAAYSHRSLLVEGSLTSAPLTTYRIEAFSDDAADAEARSYLGSFDVTTDADGLAVFSRTIPTVLPTSSEVLTTTATNSAANDTSEVSAPVAINVTGTDLSVLTPCRLIDSRDTTPLAGGTTRTITVAGRCGIPADAAAIAANVTAVSPAGSGWFALYPSDTAWPGTSTLSFRPDRTRATGAILVLSLDGRLEIRNGGSAATHFIIDVTGYFN